MAFNRSLVLIASLLAVGAVDQKTSPISKVIEMVADLQAKTIAEGQEAQKVYEEFAEYCEDRSKDLGFEIKTASAEAKDLKASIEKETATSESLDAKVGELADAISENEKELKAAEGIRAKEAADFGAEEKELVEIIDMLARAAGILEKELAKGGASMMQVKNVGSLTQAFSVMLQASMINEADASKLTALVQSSTSDDDSETGAPTGEAYESKAGNIVETVQSMQNKAEGQLEEARGKETKSLNDFKLLQQSLNDEIKFAKKDMDVAKKGIAESAEIKSKAEGDLEVTSKDLGVDKTSLSDLHHDCMTKAQDFEEETKSRNEELAVLAKAKQIIVEATSLQQEQTSFLQRSQSRMASENSAKFQAVRFVRDLAEKSHAPALAQLASRMGAAVDASVRNGGDPFAKIKGLITDMIEKLEDEANASAEKKAYCDKELGESNSKKDDKTVTIEKITTKIDESNARSATLKEEVAELQAALAELKKTQKELDNARKDENTLYLEVKGELEKGLTGIKLALKLLKDYYGSNPSGSSSGIIGLLEVCESDFTKELAEVTQVETGAQTTYDQETKDNEIETVTKNQDVKHKQKESAELDKAVAESANEKNGEQEELDAVLEYLTKLEGDCIQKPESYADKKKRREEEIAGLKEALTILDDEASLIQTKSRRSLRSVRLSAA